MEKTNAKFIHKTLAFLMNLLTEKTLHEIKLL